MLSACSHSAPNALMQAVPLVLPALLLCRCKKQPRANGTPCNDGLFCTINEFCTSGVCGGGVTRECPTQGKCEKERVCNETSNTCDIVVPVDCSSKDGQCAKGSCDPATGLCTAAPINENKPCSDGLFCTSGEGEGVD